MNERLIFVDYGNSHPHFAVYENGLLITIDSLNHLPSFTTPHSKVIASSVRKNIPFSYHFNLEDYKQKNLFFEMPFSYTQNLGIDRLIVAYGLFIKMKDHKPLFKNIVIDAGTFMTVDLVTEKGMQGGYIFPGIKTFLESYGKGERLPSLQIENIKSFINKKGSIPNNTEDAILAATYLYLQTSLKEIIREYSPQNIFITGGSCELLKAILIDLNLTIEIQSDPHFLLQSMYMIYSHHLINP